MMPIRSIAFYARTAIQILTLSVCLVCAIISVGMAGQLREVINIAPSDSLNVRTGPGGSFQDIGDIQNGAILDVQGYHKNGTWAQIWWKGGKGYVSTKYLAKPRSANSNSGTWVKRGRYRVTDIKAGDAGLNLRVRASSGSAVVAVLSPNSRLRVLRPSRNSRWVYVVTQSGQRGYVYDKYLTRITRNNSNSNSSSNGGGSNTASAPNCPLPGVFTVTNVASTDRLQVRDAANVGGTVVGSYGPSDAVAVISWGTNGWAKVSIGQETGFAKGSFLKCGGHTTNQAGFPTNLICFGAEPFWSMNINNNGTIDYRGPTNPTPTTATLQSTNPNTLTGSYPFTFAAIPYSGTINQAICSDGMSGGTYIWGAQVNVPNGSGGFNTFNGCCRMK